MGQEIDSFRFTQNDFDQFRDRLRSETELLGDWFDQQRFSARAMVAGYEMEAWLIDAQAQPRSCNEAFLEKAHSDLLTTELAQFNIELNACPQHLEGQVFKRFQQGFEQNWQHCQSVAGELDARLLAIGILPTLHAEHLSMRNISNLKRYRALNDQVLRQREGRPFQLNINGQESLKTSHHDVMLEAVSTSLQIHLQTPFDQAVRYYNASIFLSAPMVAISTNSPFLFGRNLWAETRIPVFEQSVDVGGFSGAAHGPVHRVSFGTGYARESILECFNENLEHFPVLLPMLFDDAAARMKHVALHNGTIWRWNRPLIGFDDDGTPHIRIEHRVMSSGPSIVDNIANMAFFYGLVHYYAQHEIAPEKVIEFAQARDNFYTAARHGLSGRITWIDCERCSIRQLILNRLLEQAEIGLNALNIDRRDIEFYLGIIQQRAEKQQTGADWQRAFIRDNAANMQTMTQTYYHNQQTGEPVHRWDLTSIV
jgi:hypothetical protein